MSYLQPYQNIITGNHCQKYELCNTEKDKGYGSKTLFGYKWEALIRQWRKLLDGELQSLHSSPSIGRVANWSRIRWVEHEARTPERKATCRGLVEEPEEKRPLGRPIFKSGNIKMDIFKIGWKGLDWIDVSQVRDKWRARVNTIIILLGSVKCGKVPNYIRNW